MYGYYETCSNATALYCTEQHSACNAYITMCNPLFMFYVVTLLYKGNYFYYRIQKKGNLTNVQKMALDQWSVKHFHTPVIANSYEYKILNGHVHAQFICSTCNVILSTCNVILSTCNVMLSNLLSSLQLYISCR